MTTSPPRTHHPERSHMTTSTDRLPADAVAEETARSGMLRKLALGAVVGPVLFTLTWLVLGFLSNGYTLFGTHIPSYSPISQPISGLGMGRTAPVMNTVFVLNGVLLAVGIVAIFETTKRTGPANLRRASAALLLLIPVGSIIDGLFNLEAMMPHSVGFFLATGSPAISFLVAGRYFRRLPGWRRFGTRLLIGSPVTLLLFVCFFATFTPTAEGTEHGISGLVQRILVLEVFAWLVAMAYKARRQP